MPAQKRALDASEDDPMETERRDGHQNPQQTQDHNGTSVRLVLVVVVVVVVVVLFSRISFMVLLWICLR